MLIDDENIRVQYDSTAESPIMAGDALPFPFRFIEKEQVKAILLDGTKLIFNEDYTVGLEEEEEEKPEGEDEASVSSDYTSVILNIDIPVGETITLYRETDLDQTSEFPQEARFSSRKIEDALDKLTMQNQEQREALGRAMKLPLTAAVDLKDLALPNPEPNKSVKWNSDGTALVNTSFDPDTALTTTENFKNQAQQSAKDSANSASASANSASVASQKVNEITTLHSNYMDDINTTSTNYLNQINSRGSTIIKDADAIIHRVGLNMFDTVIKDHKITYPDGQGLALQGTWVYCDAKAGERYGYPDFYERCVKEFKESSFNTPNVKNTGAVTRNGSVLSGFADGIYATLPTNFAPGTKKWEINIKATTGSAVTGKGEQNLLAFTNGITNATRFALRILITDAGIVYANLGTSTTSWTVLNTTYTLKNNTTYYFRFRFTISHYILGISTDNKNFTEFSTANTDYVTTFARCMIGNWTNYNTTATWDPWLGSIDLSGCSIYIDGQKWWDGTELYRHSNEHYYYHICSKPQIDARQTSVGMSWYYGVDEANKRIFLPRNNWFMQMASSGAGNYTDAGLPNITGNLGNLRTHTNSNGGSPAISMSGAFSATNSSVGNAGDNQGSGRWAAYFDNAKFDASRSSKVYNNSSTVQPKSVKHLLYICVGNQVQTDSWVDTITQVKNGAKEIDDSVQGAIADVEEAKDACIAEIGTKTAELTSKMAFSMFDIILKDYKLSYPYDQGFALQGTYVYHDADPGIRYGYPDFYNKCVTEYNKASVYYPTWTQPKASADTTAINGGNMVITASSVSGAWSAFRAFDSIASTAATHGWAASSANTASWWQIKFPYKIRITGLTYHRRYSSAADNATKGRFYTSSRKTTAIGNAFSVAAAANAKASTNIAGIPSSGIITDTIYLAADAISGSYCGMDYLTIKATRADIGLRKHSNGHIFYEITNITNIENYHKLYTGSAQYYGIDFNNKRVLLPTVSNRRLVEAKKPTTADQSWYNIYSDGWCEQGGFIDCLNVTNNKYTVSLMKNFVDTSYCVNTELYNEDYTTGCGPYYWCTHNKTTSSFDIFLDGNLQRKMWSACGYVATPVDNVYNYICVGNRLQDTSWIDVATQVQTGVKNINDAVTNGVNTLANASSVLTNTRVTNCVFKCPQHLDFELKNSVLTLKAGSTAIVPSGSSVKYVTTTKDLSITFSNRGGVDTVYLHEAGTALVMAGSQTSQATAPKAVTMWYDRTNNIVQKYKADGTLEGSSKYSLPLCQVINNGTKATAIKYVFNGMGFMGSYIWIDKNVTISCVNGINKTDGTPNSTLYTTTAFSGVIHERNSFKNSRLFLDNNNKLYATAGNNLYYEQDYDPEPNAEYYIWHDTRNNRINANRNYKETTLQYKACLGELEFTDNVITKWDIKQALQVADQNSIRHLSKAYIKETYRNGTSWYTVWSNGWLEQGGYRTGLSDAEANFTFLKPFSVVCGISIQRKSSNNARGTSANINTDFGKVWNVSVNGFNTWGNWGSNSDVYWVAYGYIN